MLKRLALLAFISAPVFGNTFAQWGVEPEHPSGKSLDAVKFVEFGKSGEEGKLAYTVGVGGWIDNTGYTGSAGVSAPTVKTDHFQMKGGELQEKARSSAFVEALFGVEPKSDHFYMSYKLGPAFITNTDALLGSNVQCGHEFGFGMRDVRDVRVGIVIKHFSNAGIVRPNLGRNFLGMRLEF